MKGIKFLVGVCLVVIAPIYANSFLEKLSSIAAPVEYKDMYLNERDLINDKGRRKLETVYDAACQSKPMGYLQDQLDKFLHSDAFKIPDSYPDASSELQEKFNKISLNMGVYISKIRLKGFQKDPSKDILNLNGNGGAFFLPNLIFINEIDETPLEGLSPADAQIYLANQHAIQNFNIAHELTHAKNNDTVHGIATAFVGSGIGGVGAYKLSKTLINNSALARLPKKFLIPIKGLGLVSVALATELGSSFGWQISSKAQEKRADTNAAYSSSMFDLPFSRGYEAPEIEEKGYLSGKKLLEIMKHRVDLGTAEGLPMEVIKAFENEVKQHQKNSYESGCGVK